MTSLIKAIVRFPLDILFLSIDWVRAGWLRFRRRVLRREASCPFCVIAPYGDDPRRICPSALKYGNPRLFRRICSEVSAPGEESDGLPRCRLESSYQTPPRSILPIGLALVAFWGGLAVLLQTQLGFFTHLRQLVSVPAPAVTPAAPAEDLAALEARLKTLSLEDTRTDTEKAQEYLQQANAHFAAGAHSVARLEYAIALKRDPSLQEAYRQLGRCHVEEGNFEAAEPALRRALELDPDDLAAHLAMTEVAAARNQPELALGHARAVLAREPGNVRGLLRLVQFYQAVGNRDAAHAVAEETLAAAPANADAMQKIAAMYLVFGEAEPAEALLKRTLDVKPDQIDALTSLAAILLQRDELEAGKALLARAETVDPEALPLRAIRAELAGLEGGVQDAIDAYRVLVREHPTYHPGASRLADLLLRTRQHDRLYELAEDLAGRSDPVIAARGNLLLAQLWLTRGFFSLAIETARQAAADSQASDGARFILAQAHLARKEYEQAFEYIKNLHAIHPDQAAIHLMYIRCLLELGREPEAENSYRQFIAAHPDSPEGIKLMGDYYFRQRDYARAEEAYQAALDLDPKNALIRYDLSMLLAENDADLARSEAIAQQIKAENPDNALYYDILGWVYHQQGRGPESIELLEKAVAAAPRQPIFRYHLGAALAASAPDQARQHLASALALSDDFFGAEHARELLSQIPEP